MRGHRHDRAGAVLHQHVVGDEHRNLLAVDRVRHGPPERHAGLVARLGAALLGGLRHGAVHVLADLRRVVQLQHVRVLGRHHEERRAEERVGAGGEDWVVRSQRLTSEHHLGALGPPDPVALHRDHVLGPVHGLEVVQQAVRVVGDPEEPLLEHACLDGSPAALAAPVDHLLVGEHGGVLRAPVDGRLAAVGEAALQEA